MEQTHFWTNCVRGRLPGDKESSHFVDPSLPQYMEITGLEPAAYALRTHRYPSLAISPYKSIVAHWG